MKKLIYLFILTFGIISCSSDDETGIDNSELIGKWNWISSCGGFTGDCWYPSEDNYESVEFTNDLYIKNGNPIILNRSPKPCVKIFNLSSFSEYLGVTSFFN